MDQQNNVRIDVVGSVDGLQSTAGEAERELDRMKRAAQAAGQEIGNLAQGALTDATAGMGEMGSAVSRLLSSMGGMSAGFGLAAAGVLAYVAAVKQGHEEQVQMDRALVISGDYAGTTRDQMQDLARSVADAGMVTVGVSKQLVTELVGSGRIAGDALAQIAGLADNYANATGQKVDTIAPKLVALFGDPAKGAAALNEQMHFLTNAQLEYIQTLEDSGRLGEAQLDLANRLADALPKHAKELGTLETVWVRVGQAASNAWDAMLAVGREDTLDEKLRKATELLDKRRKTGIWVTTDLEGQVADLAAQKAKQDGDAQAKAATAKQQQNEALAEQMLNSYSKTAKKMALAKRMAQADTLLPDGSGKDEVLASLRDQIIDLDKEKTPKVVKAKKDPAIEKRIRDMRDEARAELDLMHAREKEAAALAAQRVKADDLLASYGRQDAVAVQRIARGAELAAMSERERTVAEAVYAAQDQSARRQEQIIKQIADETERTRALNLEKNQLVAHIDKVTAAAAKGYDDQRTFEFGWNKAFQAYTDNATNAAATAQGAFQTMTSVLEDSLVNFATNTKFTFRDMTQNILKYLAQVAAKQAAMGLVKMGTSLISSYFGSPSTSSAGSSTSGYGAGDLGSGITLSGTRAGGGDVAAGRTYLVGEKGPELLRMGASGGTVVPNEAMGGGVSIQQVFNISGGGDTASSSGDGAGSMKRFAEMMAGVTKQVIVQEMRSGGMLERVRSA